MLARLVTVLLVLAFVVGCGSDSPAGPGGPGGPANGSMTAQIDGTGWSATVITPAMAASGSGGASVISGGSPAGAIAFAWFDEGPGTYTIPTSIGFNGNMNVASGATWSASHAQGSGTLVVTTRTANRIVGTFQFVMHPAPNSGVTGTRTISSGAFDITF
jgi:hypothetical protein